MFSNKFTKKQLLNLPIREWNKESVYDNIILVQKNKKDLHDSGYRLVYIVGEIDDKPVEIAAICDDVWFYENDKSFNVDCLPGSGCMRIHSMYKVKVGESLSSTHITFIKPN